jgi:hypothetical protein
MSWAYFQNQAAYDAYHNAVCTDQAIPRPGRIQSTQAPAILNCWTDAWVEPIQLRGQGNVITWAAHIPDAHAVTYDAVLGVVVSDSQVVFNENGTVTITGVGPQPVTYALESTSFTWRKVKPATYVMDGVTYDTTTGLPVGSGGVAAPKTKER